MSTPGSTSTPAASDSLHWPWVLAQAEPERDPLRAAICEHYLADEAQLLSRLLPIAEMPESTRQQIATRAADWVTLVRGRRDEQSALDAFMHQYDLSSDEGVLLMCLAEALLRIPDDETAEKLIADKLAHADWEAHLGQSDSLFVNASTWGLMLTGRIVKLPADTTVNFRSALNRLVNQSTEPVIRMAIRQAMRMMGSQFVMGRTIAEALKRARGRDHRGDLHSFDMLGEAALTAEDAQRYFEAYQHAIGVIGSHDATMQETAVFQRPGISVKLSALHPRYEFSQRERVLAELVPKLLRLVQLAKANNVGLTIDAEEADRLELMLDVFEAVFCDPAAGLWEGLGLAVQAFQKRGVFVIEWLEQLARRHQRRIPLRLVKGAYWDTEIKRAQELGLPGYPVFTRKLNTDVAYLACAQRLLAARDAFYPMLATHNAQTIAAVVAMAGDNLGGFEFQRLHGMGQALYQIVRESVPVACRVYAPVGAHADLLPYLVRRLLENGANTSFVNRIYDEQITPEALVADPVAALKALEVVPNPTLPTPAELYGVERRNSTGLNLADPLLRETLRRSAPPLVTTATSALAGGVESSGPHWAVKDPADPRRVLGMCESIEPARVAAVIECSEAAQARWNAQGVEARALLLERAADQLEQQREAFLFLLVREAGKTLADAVAEVREAVDFLRYYANAARRLMTQAQQLPGPTGESNVLQLHGRGVFACISPWNFPLAIFTGQIAAALVTGNTVVAKPAEQTPLIARRMVDLLHAAGIAPEVLQLVLGAGDVGAALVADPRIAGVVFTGSSEVAQHINRSLAVRPGPIATLIAETGGQNAMIVDSSALPEQVVRDALGSAFYSAGQRCSALRVLYLQHEIAGRTLKMLYGAMDELRMGDPGLLATDVGPVIDADALTALQAHIDDCGVRGWPVRRAQLPPECAQGTYCAPTVIEIPGIAALKREVFGPILHVVRYAADQIDAVVDAINATGYGLTLGVHSRVESTWKRIQSRARVGNCYVNRGMTGAVVGTQPFGGEGLSGTGPKAGGPFYLQRFVVERTLTVNTAAVGGNARLLSQSG
ncbi:bifunctional proline dehydrogenase/L-glutamate gamma-semialdehyde dehydrogenase PutA [Sinimarinibacterium sp. CAU 1509]|uniref:bifunctional proline dehydrogenase/L-glutamate gamma-semialdehyde dehydrogenase PutA n=1 Tax=Sinimarinibacterium sp. CAU 1509 TaxID=2562283 RepID=UPI0010ACA0FF|nr:bifunctional proline dehydrogenase/L-glutamate gamma-semialdehyde dehydrogenase PutA [Sinimarinibacterium sp. CAU 1509]TJY59352.1 bifunctional proline dehydrogenase/L-glutamate gamma-semialdehyde dehydrogenase PutA [Sinimarinibacterium sp. CAU 1509]